MALNVNVEPLCLPIYHGGTAIVKAKGSLVTLRIHWFTLCINMIPSILVFYWSQAWGMELQC